MGMLTKGVANVVTVVLKNPDDTPRTGVVGITFHVVESTADVASGTKIGGTSFPLTETATAGTYTGTFPFAASRLLNRHKTYRVVPYLDGVIEGAEELFAVKFT